MLRSINEILDKALENTKIRLATEIPKERIVKRTGNKRALHQKSKNRRSIWTN